MKVVLQKVSSASVFEQVDSNSSLISEISEGYLLLIAVLKGDTQEEALSLAQKIVKLRLFSNDNGKINDLSILDIKGEILVVSQFTLAGDTKKGNRPSFVAAADPIDAQPLYMFFADQLKQLGVESVKMGKFGAMMDVSIVNSGPVTLILDTNTT
ncbi:D-tyrosyl-tRNA(Tyr) deacylase [Candidatus Peregrinibacteria bacterium]|jgi:D-aminoacyl-tRNA deacylase|nr:D-tyrosyl-tRNA(Tyr) deacylase [Candidatus Peregrinibacteria bacterium]MBT3599130.1 D-tyrosyl-tRNA(Tyr) deacylase [Candidatus Peregrinibacteria bacterium]MBT4366949.1 D-tyrosyl-tRNA(Tyr) deacylase [Candidatus Peregrinibacteria bacterium]MBT4585970.1 D-tyrosyl-tRNA(Tyr) deacylase [Candidatus Peregrinibacteria bacterium]MBT6730770.1 D-tyrosyl-tRNA(Tyr) deacylase [Candidatus Peregrinibacteria bacterium]